MTAQNPLEDFGLLCDYRNVTEVRLPLDNNEKALYLKNIEKVMSIYVNRWAKIRYYDEEDPRIDPVPKLELLKRNYLNLTDFEFHDRITRIFRNLRDLNTLYFSPGKINNESIVI